MIPKPIRTAALLAALTVLFYWKILLTSQFTVLRVWEGVSQGYGWLNFAVRSIRHGHLPLWDPFTLAGHSFIGEMQTAGFSPLNLLLALVPPDSHGLLPVSAYNVYFAFMHFLGVVFAYALARELRLKTVAAVITGLCFSLGGFLVRVLDWPDLILSGIFLPLIMLFLIRALRSRVFLTQLFNAALAGFTIGIAILAGRLHMVIMQLIVVVTATAYYAWQGGLEAEGTTGVSNPNTDGEPIWPRLVNGAGLVVVVGLLAAGTGALQLFPSYAYTRKAIHYVGEHSGPAADKIPYAYLTTHSALPHSIVGFLIPFGFNGGLGEAEFLTPYIGVLPFLLAIYALVTRWANPWVRYFGFLALGSTLYSFGPFSPLHGVLYAVVPKLWWMREAGRIVYLSSFALAVLAGFGADGLFRTKAEAHDEGRDANEPGKKSGTVLAPSGETFENTGLGAARADCPQDFFTGSSASVRFFERGTLALVIASAAILVFGSFFNLPVGAWVQLSFVLIFLAYGVYRAAARGRVGRFAQCFAVFVVMFDLASVDWTPQNKLDAASYDALVKLLSCQNAVNFLKSLPGPFRVDLQADIALNIGDTFGVLTMKTPSATLPYEFTEMMGRPDLLNVQYIMKPASASEPNPAYQDTKWKIYRTPSTFQHAWLVHEVQQLPLRARYAHIHDPALDFRKVATMTDPLDAQLDPGPSDGETAPFTDYDPNRLKLTITSKGRGLLVLSEIYDSDWIAKLNGKRVAIYPVDGGLRGIVVPNGQSTVEMDYLPTSVIVGGVVTGLTFIGMLGLGLFMRRKDRGSPEAAATALPDADRDALRTV